MLLLQHISLSAHLGCSRCCCLSTCMEAPTTTRAPDVALRLQHQLLQELLARSGDKPGVARDSIVCLDNISSSKTTQYNTYGYRYHRTALEMAPSEGPAGTRNPTVARERRAVATAARRAPHAIVTARASTTRLVPEATSCAHASAHAGRKAVA